MTEPDRPTPVYQRILRGMFSRREFFWWWLPFTCIALLSHQISGWLAQTGLPPRRAWLYSQFGFLGMWCVLVFVRAVADHWPLRGKVDADLHSDR